MAVSFDEIMLRMLAHVPDTLDKREGSVIWDAIAPCARECANVYAEIEEALKNTFAGTANRAWLIKRCEEIGIAPNPASYAVIKGVFTPASLEMAIGERFSIDELNYRIIEKIADGEYALQCETKGTLGNFVSGQLIPIQYVKDLQTARLTGETLVYGEDEEETEALRDRYFRTLPTMTLDGNVAQYSKWLREFSGVGHFKVFPEWAGKNTVKCSILSTENTAATQTLIDSVQNYLDPNSEGLGMGKAPIGAIVTVSTATEKVVNVHVSASLREGYETAVDLEEDLRAYLLGLNYSRDTISYVAVSAVVANNEAIDTAFDVTINGEKENLTLGAEEIAALGEVTVEVV